MQPFYPFSIWRRERGETVWPAFLIHSLVLLTAIFTIHVSRIEAQVIAVHTGILEKDAASGSAEQSLGGTSAVGLAGSADEAVQAELRRALGTEGAGDIVPSDASTTSAREVTALRLNAVTPRSSRRDGNTHGASTRGNITHAYNGSDFDATEGPDVLDSSSYEWMQLSWLTGPSEFESTVSSIDRGETGSQLDIFDLLDLRVQFGERPAYVMPEAYQPFIDRSPRPLSRRQQAVFRVMQKEFYRHVRRMTKKEWRHRFRDSAWSYDEYIDGVAKINQLGRQPGEEDLFNADYFYNIARNDVLNDDDLEGEREVTLARYGPLGLNDRGSLDFDLLSMVHLKPQQLDFDIAPGDELKAADDLSMRVGTAANPVYRGTCVRVRPNFRIKVDPFRAFGDHPERVVRSYGGSLEFGFFSDILKRKLFSLQGEVKVRRNDEYGFFFNFVIEGWR
jgi:hypothetical protein